MKGSDPGCWSGAKGGSHFGGKDQHLGKSPEAKQYWSIYTLAYLDPKVEREFLARCTRSWMLSDRTMHVLGIIPGFLLIKTHGNAFPLPLACFWIFISFFMCPLLACLITTRPEIYSKYRLMLVCMLRVLMVLGMCFADYGGLKEVTPLAVVIRVLTKSPIAPLFVLAMNLRLPFKQHILVQFISTLAAMMWVANFCKASQSIEGFNDLFGVLGTAINRGASLFFLNGGFQLEQKVASSCLVVCAYVVIFLGSIIPTALLYSTESLARATFLSSKYELHAEELNSLELCRQETRVCLLWGAAFFSIALWITVSMQVMAFDPFIWLGITM